jgi:hypothetical protein
METKHVLLGRIARTTAAVVVVLLLLIPLAGGLQAQQPPESGEPPPPQRLKGGEGQAQEGDKRSIPLSPSPVGSVQVQHVEIRSTDPWAIHLLAGTLVPTPGLDADTRAKLESRAGEARTRGADRIHVLVQLDYIPTETQRADLAAQNIELQTYVPNNAWMAAIPASDPASIIHVPGVRWVGDWSAEDKLHPYIKEDSWGEWAIHPTQDMVMVVMQLHTDVSLGRGVELAEAHGGVAMDPIIGIHGMTVWIPKNHLLALASEEEVAWIEEGPPPLSPTNDGVRESMHVNEVQAAPYNLDGSGVRIFVFDGGLVRDTHTTFDPGSGSRVTQIETGTEADHATHVAGTAAGDGNGGRGKGVAPAATILSGEYEQSSGTMLFWDNAGDIEADYNTARNTYNADLGTNSIGSNTASNGYNCAREGDYGVSSNLLDGIVRGDNATVGSAVLMTWANGNERTGTNGINKGRCGSNYATTAPPSCAKNPIHVGATNSDYDSMTTFSSWGPCDDGRLKPIVSAAGCELHGEGYVYSSVATGDNDWGGMCGTSMATPATGGVVALMIQDWRAQGYGGANDRPLPALVKAMLIHTAEDLGQDGPDYIYGYGEVNAQAAIDLIRDGSPLGGAGPVNWGTDSVSQGSLDTFSVNVPANTAELRVSLAWDDYAAAAYAADALVNDLDLQVVAPDSTVYYPWVLNASAPYQPATTGVNGVDNQEQVVIAHPAAGTWTIRVNGTTVPQAPQTYGLVYSTRDPTNGDCMERIVNSDFESGTGSWTLSGAQRVAAPGSGHGSWSLQLGGATSVSQYAYQQVAIPAGEAHAELSFWWYMTTNEGGRWGHTYDYFYAQIYDTSMNRLATFDYRSDGWQEGQWMKSENMNLTPWAGQTVRIRFFATNDSINSTTFYVDDVSLETCSSPTAVELARFEAAPNGAAIALAWETATELDNLGFNLYRAQAPDGPRTQLNANLIPGQAPGSPVGAAYTWLDESVATGITYYYWLEDVDVYGVATLHGPVTAQLALPVRLPPARPRPKPGPPIRLDS